MNTFSPHFGPISIEVPKDWHSVNLSNNNVDIAHNQLGTTPQARWQFWRQWLLKHKVELIDESEDKDLNKLSFNQATGEWIFQNSIGQFELGLTKEWNNLKMQKDKLKAGPLKKAIGPLSPSLRVIDATTGTGKDTIFLLSWGYPVLGFERNPIIYFLLQWARENLIGHGIIKEGQWELHFGMLQEQILKHTDADINILYFDPMFMASRTKSALPRKEMQIFHQLVGEDNDQLENFTEYLKLSWSRFVVKRPARSSSWGKPNFSLEGKSIRYDIYVKDSIGKLT